MTKELFYPDDFSDLRRRAEKNIQAGEAKSQETLSPGEANRLVHELQVHQIELEMQNEELRGAQGQLESSRERYFDLYDLAPVGYFTISEKGLILEANVTGAVLLGLGRSDLVGQPFTRFILPEDQDIYYRHRKQLLAAGSPQVCELRLVRKDAAPIWARLNAASTQDDDNGVSLCRVVVSDITERKEAEESLRESDERYRSLFSKMTEGFALHEIICDEQNEPCDYRFLDVNPAFEKLTGLKRNDVIGRTMREVLPSEESSWIEIYGAVALTGEPTRFERHAVSLDRYYDVYAYRPAPRQFAVIFTDVTERKRNEDTLRETQERLALAASGTRIGMFDWNIATGDALWTEEVARLLGICTTTTTTTTTLSLPYDYRDWAERVHPEDLPQVESELRRCMSEHSPFEAEYRVAWPDGSVHWITNRGVFQYDELGTPQRMLGIIMDITDRKRAEESLRQTAERLSLAQNAGRVGVFDWDLTTNHAFWTSELEAIFGLPQGTFENRYEGWAKRVHPDDLPRIESLFAVWLQSDRDEEQWEYRYLCQDQERWISARGRILRDSTGKPVRMIGTNLDITERKRLEQEKLDMERSLLHAQKLESIGILAGGIAHDFNNILAGIMGYADLVKLRLPESEPARQDIDVIKKAVQRAADLTRQMLAYSGKGKFVVEPVSLSRVVEDSKKMLAMSVSKKATVRYNLASDLPTTLADASQIHQVILNLVINASDALGEQSGVIAVCTDTIQCDRASLGAFGGGNDLPEGLYVRLEVADTGCGMDRETLGKIFDPFFTTKFTGRGLGLAAVHGIVRGHHGAIRVVSEPGKGTTFQVLFPASDVAAPLSADESIAAKPWHGTGTVLVVDDEETIRTLAGRMIEHAGFTVLTANDGEDAVRLYRQHQDKIVCVLLDLTMPKMNGEETFHALRQISPDVRVILSSGYSEEAATTRFSQVGLAGFIQKPYQFDTMIAKLRKAVTAGIVESTSSATRPTSGTSGVVPLSAKGKSTAGQPLLGTVLVVEDDETNRIATQVIFKRAGFSTLAAKDGEDAIRVYQEHQDQIVCVFLDLTLPKMNGEETFRELRQISPEARVIVTSGYPAEALKKRLAGLDVFGFVCKPDSPDDVIAKLREAVLTVDRLN